MYDKVLVIGVGSIACNCARYLSGKGLTPLFIESRNEIGLSSRDFCARSQINFMHLEGDDLTQYLSEIMGKILIISVSNRYIFPLKVLSRKNIQALNYHDALLPKYAGRNAEAWAIFEGERFGGITWHYIVPEIDAGAIIIQKQIPIDMHTTSFSLLGQYNRIAYDAFVEIIDPVLRGEQTVSKQSNHKPESIRFSWQRPNNGELNLMWDALKTSQFLRAMDYGPLQSLGLPFFILKGTKYSFYGYTIHEEVEVENSVSIITKTAICIIKREGITFTLKNLVEHM